MEQGSRGAGLPVYQAYKWTDHRCSKTDVSPSGFRKGFLMTVQERLGVREIHQ